MIRVMFSTRVSINARSRSSPWAGVRARVLVQFRARASVMDRVRIIVRFRVCVRGRVLGRGLYRLALGLSLG
jgi:hypothetical protein